MEISAFPLTQCGSRYALPALAAALVGLALTTLGTANAQTLTDPNPKTAPARPPATKSHAASTKGCSQYGAGFAQIAGTGTCVKIGGYVTVEGSR